MDNHTHLETVLATTDSDGWRPREHDLPTADHAELPADRAGLSVADHLARAARVGVDAAVQIGCDLPAVAWTHELLATQPRLLGGVAIHPNEAVRHAGIGEVGPDGLDPVDRPHHTVPLDEAIAEVARVAATDDRIRVIGETGLDHFRAGDRGRAVQREAFREHIALAKELDLVLQIHDRDAHEAVVEVLAADGAPDRTVMHCFSGDADLARYCVEQGWYLSFAGSVTFGNADALRAALRVTPLDRVLVETDAPYLAAHPYRGRPNAPYLVAATARAVAEVLGTDLGTVCRTVRRTCEDLYGPW